MTKVKITQVKSISGQTARQRKTVEALGLKRMHHTIEKELTPQVKGMIDKVQHLLKVENA
ncbi:MAG: 50S ribosomal protein L30 [Bacteroidota bacterium]|jgi:large subunit ribosomal protein L30